MNEKSVKSPDPQARATEADAANAYEPPRLERIGTLLELTLGGFLAAPEVISVRRAGAST